MIRLPFKIIVNSYVIKKNYLSKVRELISQFACIDIDEHNNNSLIYIIIIIINVYFIIIITAYLLIQNVCNSLKAIYYSDSNYNGIRRR